MERLERKICSNNKKWVATFFVIFLMIIVFFSANAILDEKTVVNEANSGSINTIVGISVLDDKGERIVEKAIERKKLDIEINVEYQTNKDQKLLLYVLENFRQKEFEVNGEVYKNYPIVFDEAEDFEQVSLYITIKDIEAKESDFCILLVGDWSVYTRRFFIRNNNGIFIDTRNEGEYKDPIIGDEEINGEKRIVKRDEEYQLLLDFEDTIASDAYREAFIEDQDEEIYCAIVLLNSQGNILENPFYSFAINGELRVQISEIFSIDGPIKVVVFPYAHEFDKEYENTYKMVLWSSPVAILYLNRD